MLRGAKRRDPEALPESGRGARAAAVEAPRAEPEGSAAEASADNGGGNVKARQQTQRLRAPPQTLVTRPDPHHEISVPQGPAPGI